MEKYSSGETHIRNMFDVPRSIDTTVALYGEFIDDILTVRSDIDILMRSLRTNLPKLEKFSLDHLERLLERGVPILQRRKAGLERTLTKIKNTSKSSPESLAVYSMNSIADICREQAWTTAAMIFLEAVRIEIRKKKERGETR